MLYSLIAFVVLLALELLYFVVARRFHVVDRPNERSSHKKVTLRGAGVVFYLAVLLYSLTHGMAFYHFLIGASLLAVVCYADDVRDVPSWLRMLTQLAALIVAFYIPVQGIELWKILLIIIVFTGILNIFNFLDGINGMLAAYSLVVVGTFGYIDLFQIHFVDFEFIVTVFASILVFGFFNFRNHARCFSGDVGSVVMGLIVLFLLVSYVKAMPSASPSVSYLTFIIVFLADGGLTLLKRYLNGRNVFQPHREHLYETLVNELHVPHLRVAVGYALLQLLINVGFFLVADKNLYIFVCMVFLVLFYGLFFFYLNRKMEKGLKV